MLDAANAGTLRGRQFAIGILVIWSAALLRLFYVEGSGEHDAFMMAAGIVRADQSGEVLNAFCYGSQLQFLFYHLFHAASPLWSPDTPQVLLAMNVIGALSSLAVPFLFYFVLTALLGDRDRARLAILLLVSSPMYFFLASYGHPFHIALVVLLLAWLALAKGFEGGSAGWPWLIAATALHSVAMMIRFEQVALFTLLLASTLFLQPYHRIRRLAMAAAVVLVSVLAFAAAKAALITVVPAVPDQPGEGFLQNFMLLLRSLDPRLIKWGVAHLVVEAGPPLLVLGAAAFVLCVLRRRFAAVLLGLAGAVPTLAVYIGNPSPPRHYYVLVAGLACLVAVATSSRWIGRLQWAAVLILPLNFILPWGLIPFDGQPYPQRADVTFNVIERTDRNRLEIEAAGPFFRELVARAEGDPVVFFGSWIHIAQTAALLVNDPSVQLTRERLPDGTPAIVLRRAGLELFLVETYDADFTRRAVARLRTAHPRLRFISLVPASVPVNDLNVPVPPGLLLWNS